MASLSNWLIGRPSTLLRISNAARSSVSILSVKGTRAMPVAYATVKVMSICVFDVRAHDSGDQCEFSCWLLKKEHLRGEFLVVVEILAELLHDQILGTLHSLFSAFCCVQKL